MGYAEAEHVTGYAAARVVREWVGRTWARLSAQNTLYKLAGDSVSAAGYSEVTHTHTHHETSPCPTSRHTTV
jgi:hypothetical protein